MHTDCIQPTPTPPALSAHLMHRSVSRYGAGTVCITGMCTLNVHYYIPPKSRKNWRYLLDRIEPFLPCQNNKQEHVLKRCNHKESHQKEEEWLLNSSRTSNKQERIIRHHKKCRRIIMQSLVPTVEWYMMKSGMFLLVRNWGMWKKPVYGSQR